MSTFYFGVVVSQNKSYYQNKINTQYTTYQSIDKVLLKILINIFIERNLLYLECIVSINVLIPFYVSGEFFSPAGKEESRWREATRNGQISACVASRLATKDCQILKLQREMWKLITKFITLYPKMYTWVCLALFCCVHTSSKPTYKLIPIYSTLYPMNNLHAMKLLSAACVNVTLLDTHILVAIRSFVMFIIDDIHDILSFSR